MDAPSSTLGSVASAGFEAGAGATVLAGIGPLPLSAGVARRFVELGTTAPADTPCGCDPTSVRRSSRDAALRRANRLHLIARSCARHLLAGLGSSETEVAKGPRGQPLWPAGYTGSISHTADCVVVGVCPTALRRGIGIDLERIPSRQVVSEVASRCLSQAETRRLIAAGADDSVARLLAFCAKEALYKCLAPIAGHGFDPLDVELAWFDVAGGRMHLRLLDSPGQGFTRGDTFEVTLRTSRSHVFAAIELDP